MKKKYKLTKEVKEINGIKLYRIEALIGSTINNAKIYAWRWFKLI